MLIEEILEQRIAESKLEREKGVLRKDLLMEIADEIKEESMIIAVKVGSLDPEQFCKDITPHIVSILLKELEFELAQGKKVDEKVFAKYNELVKCKKNENVYL